MSGDLKIKQSKSPDFPGQTYTFTSTGPACKTTSDQFLNSSLGRIPEYSRSVGRNALLKEQEWNPRFNVKHSKDNQQLRFSFREYFDHVKPQPFDRKKEKSNYQFLYSTPTRQKGSRIFRQYSPNRRERKRERS